MPYKLIDAWKELDKKYPVFNLYDAYALKRDWEDMIVNMEKRAEVENVLMELEIKFGLVSLYDKIDIITSQLNNLELPVLGYKYHVEQEFDTSIKIKTRELKKELLELQLKIDEIKNNIYVEEDIFA